MFTSAHGSKAVNSGEKAASIFFTKQSILKTVTNSTNVFVANCFRAVFLRAFESLLDYALSLCVPYVSTCYYI